MPRGSSPKRERQYEHIKESAEQRGESTKRAKEIASRTVNKERAAFRGIEATPYDERWVVPGVFRPYEETRSVRVENADGRERGLGLSGELVFDLHGGEHTLQVAVEDDGTLWAVFADATSGRDSYRFRFLRPPAPAADGSVTVDFNRALLPPCAFADHFICPFPPPGNTLDTAVAAGERRLSGA